MLKDLRCTSSASFPNISYDTTKDRSGNGCCSKQRCWNWIAWYFPILMINNFFLISSLSKEVKANQFKNMSFKSITFWVSIQIKLFGFEVCSNLVKKLILLFSYAAKMRPPMSFLFDHLSPFGKRKSLLMLLQHWLHNWLLTSKHILLLIPVFQEWETYQLLSTSNLT